MGVLDAIDADLSRVDERDIGGISTWCFERPAWSSEVVLYLGNPELTHVSPEMPDASRAIASMKSNSSGHDDENGLCFSSCKCLVLQQISDFAK